MAVRPRGRPVHGSKKEAGVTKLNQVAGLIALGMAAAVATVAASGQKKGSSPQPVTTNYPVQVQFRDLATDAIHSDNGTAYVNGTAGVSATLNVTTTNGVVTSDNFLMQFGAVKHVTRAIHYTYTPATTPCSPAGMGPSGSMADPGYMDVWTLATMAVGSTGAKKGGFETSAEGPFLFVDLFNHPVNPYNCADMLVATHPTSTTWIVTTDTDPNTVYLDPHGNAMYPAGNPAAQPETVGSLAQLQPTEGSGFTGNYRLPFQITISCLSATSCPH
jgi:hypothetical protein